MTFQAGASLPAARSTDLVTTETADSLLVYDQDRHELHTLNSTAAAIWRLLDGQRSATDVLVAARADLGSELTLEAVQLALATLAEAHLLAQPVESTAFTAGESRRRFLKKAGIVAIPAVISVSVPLAAAHASGGIPSYCTQMFLVNGEAQCDPADAGTSCCNQINGEWQVGGVTCAAFDQNCRWDPVGQKLICDTVGKCI